MARPLGPSDAFRGGTNGNHQHRPTHSNPGALVDINLDTAGSPPAPETVADGLLDLHALQAENGQLRQLCAELEQALHEATQYSGDWENRVREYEAVVDEKTEMIRGLHDELREIRQVAAELEGQLANGGPAGGNGSDRAAQQGPMPREEELLALSEELERERRQLQEDEQTLMDQMRAMEVGMARERAEMARQRNDLMRLQSEICHEVERLERNGALQSKIEGLKSKFQDATARRGTSPASGSVASAPAPQTPAPGAAPLTKSGSMVGRWFGSGK